jgi:hypothetical protein
MMLRLLIEEENKAALTYEHLTKRSAKSGASSR